MTPSCPRSISHTEDNDPLLLSCSALTSHRHTHITLLHDLWSHPVDVVGFQNETKMMKQSDNCLLSKQVENKKLKEHKSQHDIG